jgi:hypothetical protein
MGIPIIIPCFNNHIYVANTIKQLKNINPNLLKTIIILNNESTDIQTIKYLKKISIKDKIKVINNANLGPRISKGYNPHIYNILPEKYIITDPDLEFNKDLPKNFIDILSNLSDKYKATKVGFVIKLDDYNKMYQNSDFLFGVSIYEWENQNFKNRIDDSEREMYWAGIDTTFCLYNKNYIDNEICIRVGSEFTCRHLPYYVHDDILTMYQKYRYYSMLMSTFSTVSKLYREYIESHFNIIDIRKEKILIKKEDKREQYWKEYSEINKDILQVLDKYLNEDKIFIELNTSLNKFSVYSSRNSSKVYTNKTNEYFNELYRDNCDNIEQIDLKSNINDDSCKFDNSIDYIKILDNLLSNIEMSKEIISIINIDINGQEEKILDYLIDINLRYSIPILIKIYFRVKNISNNKLKFINKNVFLLE